MNPLPEVGREEVVTDRGSGAALSVPLWTALAWFVLGGCSCSSSPGSSVSGSSIPVIRSATGTLSHKSAVTIAGTGFGSKAQAAPLVWDDASGTNVLAKWSGYWPDGAPTPSSNMQYMTAPILGGSPPHNR